MNPIVSSLIRPRLITLFVAASSTLFAQAETAQIETIRHLYQETNSKIEEMRRAPAESVIYTMELAVNSGDAPYPAVGTYKEVTRFYYTFGDREKNPYPDRLLKIEVKTNSAARAETSEFLFDATGELVFCFEKKEDEVRYYFAKGKIIRLQHGDARLNPEAKLEKHMIQAKQAQAKKLIQIFRSAL